MTFSREICRNHRELEAVQPTLGKDRRTSTKSATQIAIGNSATRIVDIKGSDDSGGHRVLGRQELDQLRLVLSGPYQEPIGSEELRGELWFRFRSAFKPLINAGKLGVVLFQFPPWFVYRRANLEHITVCVEAMEGFRIAVEFRHRSWFDDNHRENVLECEQSLGLAHVVADEPQGFANSIPSIWRITTPEVAVVRLHGRNRETWNQKGLASSTDPISIRPGRYVTWRIRSRNSQRMREMSMSFSTTISEISRNAMQQNCSNFGLRRDSRPEPNLKRFGSGRDTNRPHQTTTVTSISPSLRSTLMPTS